MYCAVHSVHFVCVPHLDKLLAAVRAVGRAAHHRVPAKHLLQLDLKGSALNEGFYKEDNQGPSKTPLFVCSYNGHVPAVQRRASVLARRSHRAKWSQLDQAQGGPRVQGQRM